MSEKIIKEGVRISKVEMLSILVKELSEYIKSTEDIEEMIEDPEDSSYWLIKLK